LPICTKNAGLQIIRYNSYGIHKDEETDYYNKITRFGMDEPLEMAKVDYELRMDMVQIVMIAYDVKPQDLIKFLQKLYPDESGS